MNILMIGNGFDLEHDLPTKYTDFLKFVKDFHNAYMAANDTPKRLNEIKNEYLKLIFEEVEFENRVNALHAFTDKNLWIDYFNKVHKKHLVNKENWIDFESEISSVIQDMDSLIKYYENLQTGANKNDDLENYYRNRLSEIVEMYSLNPENIKMNIAILLNDLNRLISALEVYIWDYVGNQKIKYYNPDIEKIHPSKVFSFNYSNTYRNLYAYNRTEIDCSFAHGIATNNIQGLFGKSGISEEMFNVYVRTSLERNNMVLGIDEYLKGDSKNKEIDFIGFKKYYQRIYKKTGNEYKKWLQQIDENVRAGRKEENILYIFGHSLDETDGDILREFITHDNLKTVIFYRNNDQLGQQIANLVKILTSDEMIERVYGSNPTIIFEKQSSREFIKGSAFEITSDTMQLDNIYRVNQLDAQRLIGKIKDKIEKKDLKYFHSQKSVITLFNVMQKNGLAKLYIKRLLEIACELMKCEGFQEPEQFNPEEWGYQDYDNLFACDSLTIKFVDSINSHNRRNFTVSESEIQSFDKQIAEYQKIIRKKEKIDKCNYITILNDIFYMFYDPYSDIEKLWNLLIRISRGPAEDVAKDTLKELIESSVNELDIIRYNHLLTEIQMNEYFDMQAVNFEESYVYEQN
ncbi:MAG: AbiH family protein [Lachnospiraceae bacterium]|nr:AbiH family protein [Lachnospiraceae bacterium]